VVKIECSHKSTSVFFYTAWRAHGTFASIFGWGYKPQEPGHRFSRS